QANHDAEASAPKEYRQATGGKQYHSECQERHPMVVVQPHVKRVFCQIWRILRHEPRVVMLRLTEKQPADVCPPGTVARRMRISILIGFLMMDTMRRHPENRTPFERERAANSEKVFEEPGDFVRPMRVQPVIAHTDTKPNPHPIQSCRDC